MHQSKFFILPSYRARPAFAPTPSPGGSESDNSNAPPLPARQQNGNANPTLNHHHHIQQSSHQHQQPHSLPFFPFHQFPGRSIKPMRKSISTYLHITSLPWQKMVKNDQNSNKTPD